MSGWCKLPGCTEVFWACVQTSPSLRNLPIFFWGSGASVHRLRFFKGISKEVINCNYMNGKNYSCHPASVEWFSIQILVNLKFSLNFSLIPSGLEDCLKSFSDRGSEISAFPSRFEQQLTHPYRIYSMKRRRWK